MPQALQPAEGAWPEAWRPSWPEAHQSRIHRRANLPDLTPDRRAGRPLVPAPLLQLRAAELARPLAQAVVVAVEAAQLARAEVQPRPEPEAQSPRRVLRYSRTKIL